MLIGWKQIMINKILIAEDEVEIAELLSLYLESEGFETVIFHNGKEALESLKKDDYEVLLADIMMPEMNGYELIKEVRKINNIPVIIISAKAGHEDRILGLNIGADAYITKPFNPLEVVAYVKAAVRRNSMNQSEKQSVETLLKIGELEFDMHTNVLKKSGRMIQLTATEIKILAMMMREPDRVFTKTQIYEQLRGEFFVNDDNTVIVHISNLRQKIEDDPSKPRYIKTIRGLGYKFAK